MHISALSEKFIKDPREVVKAGDVVKVKVMEVQDTFRAKTRRPVDAHERHSLARKSTAPVAHAQARPPAVAEQRAAQGNRDRRPGQQRHGFAVRQCQAVAGEEALMEIPAGLTQSAFSELIDSRLQRLEPGVAEVALTLEPHLRNRAGVPAGRFSAPGGHHHGAGVLQPPWIRPAERDHRVQEINYIRAVEDGDVLCTE